jgi:hypothetical protein
VLQLRSKFAALSPVMVTAAREQKVACAAQKHTNFLIKYWFEEFTVSERTIYKYCQLSDTDLLILTTSYLVLIKGKS